MSRRLRNTIVALAYVIVAVIGPATTTYAFGGGNGSEGSPYIITSCEELQDMADDLDAHYKLGNNIDCADTVSWNAGKGYDPVGDSASPFTGSLDGAGYVISNLSILRANDNPDDSVPGDALAEGDEEYVGLFGYLSNAEVNDVHIRTSKIKGFAYVGGITGYMNGGSITNSSVNTATENNTCEPGSCVWARYGYFGGGIVGYLESGTITNVATGGPVKGSGFRIGGLVGSMHGGSLSDASSSSWADGGTAIGGAIGEMSAGSVARVYASGRAYAALDESAGKGGRNVGGFIGVMQGGTISDSYATGDVVADGGVVGGFVGNMSQGNINRSYASGDVVSDSGNTAGGFVGSYDVYVEDVDIIDSFTVSSLEGSVGVSAAFAGSLTNETNDTALANVYYDRTTTNLSYCYNQPRRGSGVGEFNEPSGIATDSSGYVYVADSYNNRIQKFTSTGNYVTQWGVLGYDGEGEFDSPYDVATDSTNNVYVADSNNNRIQKFNSNGVFMAEWGSEGSANGQFFGPVYIAIDGSDNIYVVDNVNSRVQKFDSDGTYISQWGTFGSGNGQLINPYGIALDSSNNVYIADNGNSRVQKFDSDGTYISQWGTFGSGNGEFIGPVGVATDSLGNVYVGDAGNSRIQKFTSMGTYITSWGASGESSGEFVAMRDVSVDSSGSIYVSDVGKQSIQKFSSSGDYIMEIGKQPTSNAGCTGVNAANSQPDYFFNAANEPFAGNWSQEVWSFSGSALPVLAAQDSDNDGTINAIENAAPNNGDGNNDGIPDTQQPHVTSLVNTETNQYVTVVTPEGTTITTVTTEAAPAEDGFTHLFGLVGFTVSGLTPGSTIPIEIFYPNPDNIAANSINPKKYFPSTAKYEDLTGATVANLTIASQPTLRLNYSLTDGSTYDLDGSANGEITDPVSLATANTNTETLADTGQSHTLTLTLAITLLSTGLYTTRKRYTT